MLDKIMVIIATIAVIVFFRGRYHCAVRIYAAISRCLVYALKSKHKKGVLGVIPRSENVFNINC